jgi:hypothetical protein
MAAWQQGDHLADPSQTRGQLRARIALSAIAVLLVAHALFYSVQLGWDVVDDAYISFRYAQNAARGYGLTFNRGEAPVEGYTNFLWTALMIPATGLGLPVGRVALALGLCLAVGGLLLTWRAARSLGWGAGCGALAALLLAADGSYALWAVGGLEGPLFALLLLLGALTYLGEMRDPAKRPISGLWFALAAMTRPEGTLVFALTGLHQVATRLIRERRGAARQDWLRLGEFIILWGAWFLWRWRYYGHLFTNSFYAKVTLEDTAAQTQRGLRYLSTYLRIHLGWPLLALAFVPLVPRRGRYGVGYLLLMVGAYTAYIAYVGGDWSVGRFFALLMPLFYLLVARGLASLGRWIGPRLPARRLHRLLASLASLGLAGGLFVASSLGGELKLFIEPFNARLAGEARTTMGRWLHQHLPPDRVIAVDAAGQLAFYSELRTIDLFGINDVQIARKRVSTMGQGTPGHEKFGLDEALARRPDYIIIYGTALDYLATYRRVDLPWTDVPEYRAFLSTYEWRE